jgi:hypothetical protein
MKWAWRTTAEDGWVFGGERERGAWTYRRPWEKVGGRGEAVMTQRFSYKAPPSQRKYDYMHTYRAQLHMGIAPLSIVG